MYRYLKVRDWTKVYLKVWILNYWVFKGMETELQELNSGRLNLRRLTFYESNHSRIILRGGWGGWGGRGGRVQLRKKSPPEKSEWVSELTKYILSLPFKGGKLKNKRGYYYSRYRSQACLWAERWPTRRFRIRVWRRCSPRPRWRPPGTRDRSGDEPRSCSGGTVALPPPSRKYSKARSSGPWNLRRRWKC